MNALHLPSRRTAPARGLPPWSALSAVILGLFTAAAHGQVTPADVTGEVEDLVSLAGEDPNMVLPSSPTESVFGLSMNPVETPRSYTVLSSEMLQTLSIRNSEDISRIAPSTFSNFRFGLQGNVSIRNQTSDFYFRGMRRIDPQGNYRTVYAANDSIEIVRGPPSPIYGLGRIGGYVNFNPKTARLARTGKYLERSTGYVSATYGSYERRVLQADVGGPVTLFGRKGGYQAFGYFEDSGSYYALSPPEQHKLAQLTLTLDLNDTWRMETGGAYQYSKGGLPGSVNRTTQDLIDSGQYWRGEWAYSMDRNGDGQIGDRELFASYFGGLPQNIPGDSNFNRNANIGASLNYRGQTNGPLRRFMPWQGGPVNGGTITVDQFLAGYLDTAPTLAGGTATQRQGVQLMVYPERADGTPDTTQAKVPFYMPYGFDPQLGTWEHVPADLRLAIGEDFYSATVPTFFFDLIADTNPDFTIKNQILMDAQDQEKRGRNGFSQLQNMFQFENKLTVTKKWDPAWDWLRATTLASANFFYHDGNQLSDSGDYDGRRDLIAGFNSNNNFISSIVDSTWDGEVRSTNNTTKWNSWGFGALGDFSIADRANVLLGGRVDTVYADGLEAAGRFNRNGNGAILGDNAARATDTGYSYSASFNYKLPYGFVPYFTYANQSSPITNAGTNGVPVAAIRRGAMVESVLKEFGLKASFLEGRVFASAAYFYQTRSSFDPNDGDGALGSTLGEGVDGEIRWVVNKNLNLIGGFSFTENTYLVSTGTIVLNGRDAGFPDVVDAAGNVVIPAEAFAWGGWLNTTVPAGENRYDEVFGVPNTLLNLTGIYSFANGMSVRLTAYHQGGFATNRLGTVVVPKATVYDGGLTYRRDDWEARLSVSNLFDKQYFNAHTFLATASARLPRTYEVVLTRKF